MTHSNLMRSFVVVWMGQLVSRFGSEMTWFAIQVWAWEQTGQVTTLALVGFFSLVPSIFMSLVAGMMVDRFDRKLLMMVGDTVAILGTLTILWLHLTDNLQIWHLYITGAVEGAFGEIQDLAYTTSITVMVPRQYYTRASSMGSFVNYGSKIIAPALAGSLYPVIGLLGILWIDIGTFTIAIATLLIVSIPQPAQPTELSPTSSLIQNFIFGFHYILTHPSLRSLLLISLLFEFFRDLSNAIVSPMILARTSSDTAILGSVSAAAGVGGVLGAIPVSIWGSARHQVKGMLLGMVGVGVSKTIFGFGQAAWIWIPTQFCSSFSFPLMRSSRQAIWLAQVAPKLQGRVFAAHTLIWRVVSTVALLMAGPFADRVFEPAMTSSGSLAPKLSRIFGTGQGAGMALLYVLCALGMLSVGLGGYRCRGLRDVDDFDVTEAPLE
jgi:MFS transporter, DHA3 family, macrolide efflux protein